MEPGSQPILGQRGTFELLPQNVAGTISRAQTTFRETIGPAQRPAEDCSEFPVPSGPFSELRKGNCWELHHHSSHGSSLFFNYKGVLSLALLAMADAHYNFRTVNVGGNGRRW